MKNVEQFLLELKGLQDRHGIYIHNRYDEAMDLHDDQGNTLAEYVDFETGGFSHYIHHAYGPQKYPRVQTLTLDAVSQALKSMYMPKLETYPEEPLIVKMMKEAKK